MKMNMKLLGIILIASKLSAGFDNSGGYMSNKTLTAVNKISISKLLDFENIAISIEDEFDKARFYYIIAFEIGSRMDELDDKFYSSEDKYLREVTKFERELNLTAYKYMDNRPRFDYEYQHAEITEAAIDNNIHHIQAKMARSQFIQVYKYYRKRLDNYKNYLVTLRELYKCKVIQSKENKVEFFSNFPQLQQGIKLFHEAADDEGIMQVHRDVLGKVRNIDWEVEGEDKVRRRREFEYFNNGLLSKLKDKIDDQVVFETWFGENDIGKNFLEYIFTPGFMPRDYNYYTEVYYGELSKPTAYKFVTNNGHIIGAIYREYDDKDHLVKETWCKGETSKILREFSSIFDPATGDYKVIERDRSGNIVYQEIVLSSND